MNKVKIDDDTRIGLACDIAHYILMEYVVPALGFKGTSQIIKDNPNDEGTEYTEFGQDLFDPIFDKIEDMIIDWEYYIELQRRIKNE